MIRIHRGAVDVFRDRMFNIREDPVHLASISPHAQRGLPVRRRFRESMERKLTIDILIIGGGITAAMRRSQLPEISGNKDPAAEKAIYAPAVWRRCKRLNAWLGDGDSAGLSSFVRNARRSSGRSGPDNGRRFSM